MGSCPVSEGDEQDLFLAAVSDAAALSDRSRVKAGRGAPRAAVSEAKETTPWVVESQGHKIRARAPGVNRSTLRRLGAGERKSQATLDLHGLDAVAARRKLGEFLTRSRDEQHQCVLVVSGRGTHSNGEAVLQRAVVDWITGPLSRHALAVATAAPKDGGEGAYYVLLRKK